MTHVIFYSLFRANFHYSESSQPGVWKQASWGTSSRERGINAAERIVLAKTKNLTLLKVRMTMKLEGELDTISGHWPATTQPDSQHLYIIVELPSGKCCVHWVSKISSTVFRLSSTSVIIGSIEPVWYATRPPFDSQSPWVVRRCLSATYLQHIKVLLPHDSHANKTRNLGEYYYRPTMIYNKLMAVPTARVARRLAPLTFSTGLQLVGGVAPKPPFCPLIYIYSEI